MITGNILGVRKFKAFEENGFFLHKNGQVKRNLVREKDICKKNAFLLKVIL